LDIKQRGGTIIAQNEATCVVFGMPKAAYLTGCVDRMISLECLASEIHNFSGSRIVRKNIFNFPTAS
jgi:chemotaxis response regulator CheB